VLKKPKGPVFPARVTENGRRTLNWPIVRVSPIGDIDAEFIFDFAKKPIALKMGY